MLRFLPVLTLCACSAVAPLTALRLSALDPLTADPAAIALAVTLPDGLRFLPGTARLEFGASRGAETVGDSFTLQEQDGLFVLSEADAARMRQVQAEVIDWKAEGQSEGPTEGRLGIALGACGVNGGPGPDATGSVFIRLEQGGDLLPLIVDGRIVDLIGLTGIEAIVPCEGPE